MVDSHDRLVGVIETMEVRVVARAEVDVRCGVDEGEGHVTVADGRRGHDGFWRSEEMAASLGGVARHVDDETPVVAERCRVVERRLSATE